MTRLKLIPWLAIPVLLLLGPGLPTATAATPASVELEDGLIYLPLDEAWQMSQGANVARLGTSAVLGEVTVAQYGVADALVANRNGFLCVRFDFPYDAPYTVTKLSFQSQTANPTGTARFRSVRVMGMTPGGMPDKAQTYYHQRRYIGSGNGGVNQIPLSIAASGPLTLFAVFDFPAPTAGVADTFPFLFTDRDFHDAGLFANSYATDTNAVVRVSPPYAGTFTGSALLADQNVHASMTCQLTDTAPLNAPSALGVNVRDSLAAFTYIDPANQLADGTPVPSSYFETVELVERTVGWNTVASGGTGSGRIGIESLPPGFHIWGVRALDANGNRSIVSNVTISDTATVVGTGSFGEDADENNGLAREDQATALTLPVTDRAESVWPAGDLDHFWFTAASNDVITARAEPTNVDFRNDLAPVIHILDKSGDILATEAAEPGNAAEVMFTVPLKKNGQVQTSRFFVLVRDRSGSPVDPTASPRVLVPPTYKLSVAVSTPAALAQFGPSDAPVSSLLDPDAFAFANAGRNPVRGDARFAYVIPRSASGGLPVRVSIYDVRGRLMSTVVNGVKTAGTHYASWSGHDSRGNRAGAGPYFARMDVGVWSRTVRIDLMK